MLATIRNLGDCPCPRCLVPLSLADRFGTPEDRQFRVDKARMDDSDRQTKVSTARKLIYGKITTKKNTNYDVGSAAVERLLKDQSLVPTDVSNVHLLRTRCCLILLHIECIFKPSGTL